MIWSKKVERKGRLSGVAGPRIGPSDAYLTLGFFEALELALNNSTTARSKSQFDCFPYEIKIATRFDHFLRNFFLLMVLTSFEANCY